MGDEDQMALIIGFAGAIAVLTVLVSVVGVDRTLAVLSSADPILLGLVAVLSLSWLVAWGLALHTVLGSLDVDVTAGESLLLYAAAVFANNVTPLGQAGGEPVSAFFISRTGRVRYETGLGAIASLDALNLVPSMAMALLGLSAYAATVAVGSRFLVLAGITVSFALGVGVVLSSVWRYRERIATGGGSVIATAIGLASRMLPWVSPREPADVSRRIGQVFESVEDIVADRRRLSAILALLGIGWLFQVGALFVAFRALGVPVPVLALLFVVPVSNIAGVIPFPGGLGGIETALVVLLTLSVSVPAPTAAAAALIFRAGVYWLPVVGGGGAIALLGVSVRR